MHNVADPAIASAENSYDAVPYASYPYFQSHPQRLATVAHLFGMAPANLSTCRVLELGTSSGGNLLPMAAALPDATFVGIDLSSRQVEDGRQWIAAAGLKNVELRHADILDVSPEWGQFDYILSHGVFSWVPAEVREHMLRICRQNLAPNGVAYLSYNTYPGWHLRGLIRDMMSYHGRKFSDPRQRVKHGRALLDFLVRTIPTDNNAYGLLLKNEMDLLRDKSDSYLLHEHLESVNHPLYFHEFEAQAAAAGLQYLGESDIGSMLVDHVGGDAASILRQISSNFLELEQYLDFIRNRTFRQTLLCHQEQSLDRRSAADRMRQLYVAAHYLPQGAVDYRAGNKVEFQSPRGTLTTADPMLKAALVLLAQRWPEAIPFERLAAGCLGLVHPEPLSAERSERLSRGLSVNLLDCFAKRLLEVYAHPLPCSTNFGDFPVATALARAQARQGRAITNLLHQIVDVNDVTRQLIARCDGAHDRSALLQALLEMFREQKLVMHAQEQPIRDEHRALPMLEAALDRGLAQLARDGLLIARP